MFFWTNSVQKFYIFTRNCTYLHDKKIKANRNAMLGLITAISTPLQFEKN
jgi:hypothetical protein